MLPSTSKVRTIEYSTIQRIYRLFIPPKPVVIRAGHYLKSKPLGTLSAKQEQSENVVANFKAHGASQTKSTFTKHFSTKPNSALERRVMFAGGAVFITSVVYWALSRDEVVLTHRHRTMAFSWEFERDKFGRSAFVDKDDSKYGDLIEPEDDVRSLAVHEIAKRIITVAEEDFPEIRGKIGWKVYVRKNRVVNAFYMPGGTLTVFTGLIDTFAKAAVEKQLDNCIDALAAVIAHECSHGLGRHGMEKLSWLPIQLPFLVFTPDVDLLWESFSVFFKLPHSRVCETEADIIGVNLMARAGFDPHEAEKMFRVLDNGGKLFEWRSTHPVGETRAEEIRELLPEVLPLYEANKHRFPTYQWPDLEANWVTTEKKRQALSEMEQKLK
jgi:predicted Zn-dependent protease